MRKRKREDREEGREGMITPEGGREHYSAAMSLLATLQVQ